MSCWRFLCALVLPALITSTNGMADTPTYAVERWASLADSSARTALSYRALDKAMQRWRLCAALPHRKDDYWRAVEWGLEAEAKRLGVELHLIYAGGYDQLPQQIRQLRERCQDGQHDAVILGAIDEQGLNDSIRTLAQAGLPVIDLVNGVQSPAVTAKAMVSFRDMGAAAARYINGLCQREQRRFRLAWLPGPDGAAWVRTGDEGFRATLDPRCGEIVHSAFGDTGIRVQMGLVEAALRADPALDLIVGTAVTAEAASHLLRAQQRPHTRVIAYYMNASVYRGLREQRILAAPTDSPVIQARLAVDLAVRVLEKQPHALRVGPRIQVVDQQTLADFVPETALAPTDIPAP